MGNIITATFGISNMYAIKSTMYERKYGFLDNPYIPLVINSVFSPSLIPILQDSFILIRAKQEIRIFNTNKQIPITLKSGLEKKLIG